MLFRGFVPRVPCLALDLIPRYVPACSPCTRACPSTPPVCPAGTRLTSLVGGPLPPACSSQGLETQQSHTWPRSEDLNPPLTNSLFHRNPEPQALSPEPHAGQITLACDTWQQSSVGGRACRSVLLCLGVYFPNETVNLQGASRKTDSSFNPPMPSST